MPSFASATLVASRPAASDQIWLEIEPPPGFRDAYVRPGQFCQIRLEGDEGYFAMYSAPGEPGPLRFLLRVGNPERGECADRLAASSAGTVIEMTHPLGKGFDLDRAAGKPVCLVGTGTGVAPVRAALEALLSEGASPTSLSLDHGLRSEAHLAVGDAVAVWRAAGVTVRISFSTLEEGQLVGTTVQDTLFAARTDFTGVAMVAVGQNALLADLRARFEAAGGLREDFLTNV